MATVKENCNASAQPRRPVPAAGDQHHRRAAAYPSRTRSPATSAWCSSTGVAWCPYCYAQLRAFERASQALADAGIRVAALSVDDRETTVALAAKLKLTFPIGYGADAKAAAALTGAFVNPDPVYLQSTGFVLDPAGNVVVSVYSSGAIGRLVSDDVIGLVRYLCEHSPTATA